MSSQSQASESTEPRSSLSEDGEEGAGGSYDETAAQKLRLAMRAGAKKNDKSDELYRVIKVRTCFDQRLLTRSL